MKTARRLVLRLTLVGMLAGGAFVATAPAASADSCVDVFGVVPPSTGVGTLTVCAVPPLP